jgi:hypothetical protein
MTIKLISLPARFLSGSLNLLILITILLGIGGGVVKILSSLPNQLMTMGLGDSLLVLGLVAIPVSICVFLWVAKNPPKKYAFTALMLYIIGSRLIFVAIIEQPLLSDYLTMWQYVISVVNYGYIPPDSISAVRTMAYLLPVALLFDGWQFSYQIINTLVVALCAGLVYFLTRELADGRAALIALAVVAFSPEPLFAVEITSHDIPSTLYLLTSFVLVLLIVYRIGESKSGCVRIVILSFFLGVALFFLDLQRGIGVFVYLGVFLVVVLFSLKLRKRFETMKWFAQLLFFLIVLPYSVSLVCISAVDRWLLADDLASVKSRHTLIWAASYANAESDGSWVSGLRLMSPYVSSMSDIELREFVIARSLSDFADNFFTRPRNYYERIGGMYRLGTQTYAYFGDALPNWLISDPQVLDRAKEFFIAYSMVFVVLFLSIAGIALIYVIIGIDPDPWFYLPILPVALLTFMLTIMGENQPRYMFPLWFILPIYIGLMVRFRADFRMERKELLSCFSGILHASIAAFTFVFLIYMILQSNYDASHGRLFYTRAFNSEGDVEKVSNYRVLLKSSRDDSASVSGNVWFDEADTDYSVVFFARPILTYAVVSRMLAQQTGGGEVRPPSSEGKLNDPFSHDSDRPVTRAGIAVLLLRAKYGADYLPPPASGTVFRDVSRETVAADWIEQLAAEGITSGCGSERYCPNHELTGSQLAVLLVRALNLPMERARNRVPFVLMEVTMDGHLIEHLEISCGDPLQSYTIGIGSTFDGRHHVELRARASSYADFTCPVFVEYPRLSRTRETVDS